MLLPHVRPPNWYRLRKKATRRGLRQFCGAGLKEIIGGLRRNPLPSGGYGAKCMVRLTDAHHAATNDSFPVLLVDGTGEEIETEGDDLEELIANPPSFATNAGQFPVRDQGTISTPKLYFLMPRAVPKVPAPKSKSGKHDGDDEPERLMEQSSEFADPDLDEKEKIDKNFLRNNAKDLLKIHFSPSRAECKKLVNQYKLTKRVACVACWPELYTAWNFAAGASADWWCFSCNDMVNGGGCVHCSITWCTLNPDAFLPIPTYRKRGRPKKEEMDARDRLRNVKALAGRGAAAKAKQGVMKAMKKTGGRVVSKKTVAMKHKKAGAMKKRSGGRVVLADLDLLDGDEIGVATSSEKTASVTDKGVKKSGEKTKKGKK